MRLDAVKIIKGVVKGVIIGSYAVVYLLGIWTMTFIKTRSNCPECNPNAPITETIGVDREIVYTNGRAYYINKATNTIVLLDTIQATGINPYRP